jgi:hypothetical protein
MVGLMQRNPNLDIKPDNDLPKYIIYIPYYSNKYTLLFNKLDTSFQGIFTS